MRIVLDTNQLVASLVRPPELATLLMSWESARFIVVASKDLLTEYELVLDYPDISNLVYPELLRSFKQNLIHDIEVIEPLETPQICRDPDDDKVIAAAIYGLVDYLVTADQNLKTQDVTDFLQELGIQIIDGDELMSLLDEK